MNKMSEATKAPMIETRDAPTRVETRLFDHEEAAKVAHVYPYEDGDPTAPGPDSTDKGTIDDGRFRLHWDHSWGGYRVSKPEIDDIWVVPAERYDALVAVVDKLVASVEAYVNRGLGR